MSKGEHAGTVAIKPRSSDPDALESLDMTLRALRGGGPLHRVGGEVWKDPAGFVYAVVPDPGFVAFAVKRQGYGVVAFDVSSVVSLPEEP